MTQEKEKMVIGALSILAIVIIGSLFALSMFFGRGISIATGVVMLALYLYTKPTRDFHRSFE